MDMAFKDVSKNALTTVQSGCQLHLFDCSKKYFSPYRSITRKDFLEWFFKLKYLKQPDFLKTLYPSELGDTTRYWQEANRLNLLADGEFTYQILQEFLYRNTASEANLDQPYQDYLVIDLNEINSNQYHNLKEIDWIKNKLSQTISNFEKKEKLMGSEKPYFEKLKITLKVFNELEKSLIKKPYILTERPDFSPEVTRAVREYSLQEVLYSYSYDYSKNPGYRKYNLVTGVQKMHGKVFQPGDVIDYWKIISDRNLWDFRYGWVIANGGEEWQFGGGICGSATLVFIPVWKTGLEILERRNHSQFYSSLYPKENIGLDATVYRPRPNLKARNTLDMPIVFNVRDDKAKQVVTIEIIGNRSYKNIKIEGPIFINKYHVKWIRQLEEFDGKISTDILESRYSAIY